MKMLNAESFIKMKPTAFFINIGRGEIVDEDDLVQVLKEGRIAGAALDTFSQEPLPSEHPFWEMENVIITPHVGGLSDVYVQQAASVFHENLKRFIEGEEKKMINLVPRM
jgi:phosphoglycerate dehydrogenase-like enzyme